VSDNACSVSLTFDFDGMSLWIGTFKSNNPSMISRGEFGTVGVERLLALLKKYDIPSTFCIPGHTAYCYPDLVRRIDSEGHEIAHHGWVHENPATFDRDGERGILERAFEALDWAAGVRPIGYRSPAWDLSPNSIDLLIEFGFVYDSSCMGSDFYPYYLRRGDSWSTTEPYIFGETTELVEIPVTWGLDDFPPYEYVPGANMGLYAPSAVREIWQGDFDYMIDNCPGGIYNLTMHPQVTGRGHRMRMLEELIQHFRDAPNVRFERLGDYAKRWREEHPVDDWKERNPHYTGAGAYEPAQGRTGS
jgi:peptidoglycan/xylan/chitin deacetylase (PgdA/CDA1 family)